MYRYRSCRHGLDQKDVLFLHSTTRMTTNHTILSIFLEHSRSGISEDKVEPFTLYGSVKKKYLIERVEGEKIVSRSPGFTVKACVGAVRQSEETPQMQGTPFGKSPCIYIYICVCVCVCLGARVQLERGRGTKVAMTVGLNIME